MLYSENCNKYFNVQYYEDCIKIIIINIPNNNYDMGNLYFEILEIFKLNKIGIIIEYLDTEFSILDENNLKQFF